MSGGGGENKRQSQAANPCVVAECGLSLDWWRACDLQRRLSAFATDLGRRLSIVDRRRNRALISLLCQSALVTRQGSRVYRRTAQRSFILSLVFIRRRLRPKFSISMRPALARSTDSSSQSTRRPSGRFGGVLRLVIDWSCKSPPSRSSCVVGRWSGRCCGRCLPTSADERSEAS